MKKVLIGLSGGVDSSVAAALLKEKGYDVHGITLKLTDGDDSYIRDAQTVADTLGIPFTVLDFRKEFREYVETEFGIFPLKYFFSEGMTNKDGETQSTRAIKECLQQIIKQEDKSAPLTDDDLVVRMNEAGYPIARRTVAKYRDQLNIPVARLRRQV